MVLAKWIIPFKKTVIFLIYFFLAHSTFFAQNEKICEINFNNETLNDFDFVSLKIYTANKKLVKECQGIQFNKVIEKGICKLDNQDLSSLLFVAYGRDGKKVNFFYSDISPKLAKIPIFIAFREKMIVPDTVKISGISGIKINPNEFKKVQEVYTFMQVYRIYLQIKEIPPNQQQYLMKNYFLMFPQDQTTERWIGDLVKIEIYKIKD